LFAHPDWRERFERRSAGGARPEWISPPRFWPPVAAGFIAALRLGGRRFDALLLGNVANRLIPMLRAARLLRLAPRCVLIAHREPSARGVSAQRAWHTDVIAVNETIAGHYRRAGFERVEVSYGITDAHLFHPPEQARDGDTVNFCVVGDLDRAWKGADTAVAAYREMPPAVRRRSGLHLASYRMPAPAGDAGIVAHEWMPFDRMPGFLRGMDVMLVPSRDEGVMRETFSQAAVQGMLTGLPLVVSNLPVLAEKVAGGGGMVFHDAGELARQMTALASDSALRRKLGDAARRTAVEKYVWNTADFARRHVLANATPQKV